MVGDDGKAVRLLTSVVLRSLDQDSWATAATRALAALTQPPSSALDLDVFAALLPCLFMMTPSKVNFTVIKELMTSPLVTKNATLKNISAGIVNKFL